MADAVNLIVIQPWDNWERYEIITDQLVVAQILAGPHALDVMQTPIPPPPPPGGP